MSNSARFARWPAIALLAASFTTVTTGVQAASLYTITDLGTLPGTSLSFATGLNDLGQVVGYSENANGTQSFLYSNGQLTPIKDPLSGVVAGGINNSGQVVSVGQFINNSGQVVSSSQPFQVPVTTTSNGVTTTSQATFTPAGINDPGQVAGTIEYSPTSGFTVAGIYQNGKFFDISKALGLSGDPTMALGINNVGSVLLYDFHEKSDTATYLVYKADGTAQVLGLGGAPTAMNDRGQVVGGNGLLLSNGSITSLYDLIPPAASRSGRA